MESRFSESFYADIITKAYQSEPWYMPYSKICVFPGDSGTPVNLEARLTWIKITSAALDINPKIMVKQKFMFFYDMCRWILDNYYDRAFNIYKIQIRGFWNSWMSSLKTGLIEDGFSEKEIEKCLKKWLRLKFEENFIWSYTTIKIMLSTDARKAINFDFNLIEEFRQLLIHDKK